MRAGLPSMRSDGVIAVVRDAIRAASREAFRVIEFSIQENHAHFIVEAHDKDALSRGLRGLAIRLARTVNRAMGFRGSVWGDRYHARALKTPRAVRNAIVYVLMNAKKHRVGAGAVDTFSSAPWFRGFRDVIEMPRDERPTARARTWLANVGWKKRGLVRLDEQPRAPD